MKDPESDKQLPLFIPHSSTTTAVNKTGSWRFYHPKYEEKTAPCSAACPLGQDIARIEMLTGRGQLDDAWQAIVAENPFPAVCGRVCFHPCEDVCNRAGLDEAIAIHSLERFLADRALSKATRPDAGTRPSNGKKVAIAGAGPAGLAAAHFLVRLGYSCDVFEAAAQAGGLLRWGIPPYRLPRDILELEIRRVAAAGVNIFCQTPVTPKRLERLRQEYDALFIGCGFGRSIRLLIEGGDLAADGLQFLQRLNDDARLSLPGTAAIIGGGNTAVDVARCLVRLGAAPLIVYRRRIADMPAFEPEVAMAVAEGVRIMELAAPTRIREISADGPEYELTLQKMKVSRQDEGGRARVVPAGSGTTALTVKNVIAAIGAVADNLWQFPDSDPSETLELSHCKFAVQETPMVFGGDLASPVKSVADAIASGKQAAMALDTYFANGADAIAARLAACRVGPGPALSMAVYLGEERNNRSAHIVDQTEIVSDYFQTAVRCRPAVLATDIRRQSLGEIESTLDESSARDEALRCFNCGICSACDYCRLYCPEMAVVVEDARRSINMDYCKGCGVCATECPRNAMALEEETR